MYRTLSESTDRVLGYEVSGTITQGEVAEIQREITDAIGRHGKVRILCQMGELDVPKLSAVWEDLKFTPQYIRDVERFALVGDKGWHQWVTSLSDRLTHAEARYFEGSQLPEAWRWIKGED
jgi:hypothetical protein